MKRSVRMASGLVLGTLVTLSVVGMVCVKSPAEPTKLQAQRKTLKGKDALGDWTTDAPGVPRRITVNDLPKPYDTESVDNGPRMVGQPEGAWPKAPAGFKVER